MRIPLWLMWPLTFLVLAWTHPAGETQRDKELMHAYACGYQFAINGNQCADLRELAEKHGFRHL